MNFLPDNYEQPQGGGRYTKLKQGENRIRIISNSIIGWLGWTPENKPVRVRMDHKHQLSNIALKDNPRHFWAFQIWSYTNNQIEIFEITQRTIQDAIMSLYKSSDWGDPKGYDIIITKTGEGMETNYHIQGGRTSQLDAQKVKEFYHNHPCDISKLYDGKDPWELTEDEKLVFIAEFDKDFDDLPF